MAPGYGGQGLSVETAVCDPTPRRGSVEPCPETGLENYQLQYMGGSLFRLVRGGYRLEKVGEGSTEIDARDFAGLAKLFEKAHKAELKHQLERERFLKQEARRAGRT